MPWAGPGAAASSGFSRSLPLKEHLFRGQTRACFAGVTHHEPDIGSGGGDHRMGVRASSRPMCATNGHSCGHRAMGTPTMWWHGGWGWGGGHGGAHSVAALQEKLPWSGGLATTRLLFPGGTKVPQFSPLKGQKLASCSYCQTL